MISENAAYPYCLSVCECIGDNTHWDPSDDNGVTGTDPDVLRLVWLLGLPSQDEWSLAYS